MWRLLLLVLMGVEKAKSNGLDSHLLRQRFLLPSKPSLFNVQGQASQFAPLSLHTKLAIPARPNRRASFQWGSGVGGENHFRPRDNSWGGVPWTQSGGSNFAHLYRRQEPLQRPESGPVIARPLSLTDYEREFGAKKLRTSARIDSRPYAETWNALHSIVGGNRVEFSQGSRGGLTFSFPRQPLPAGPVYGSSFSSAVQRLRSVNGPRAAASPVAAQQQLPYLPKMDGKDCGYPPFPPCPHQG